MRPSALALTAAAAASMAACGHGDRDTTTSSTRRPAATARPTTAASAAIPKGLAAGKPVTYTAQVFMRGMRVTVPNAEWVVWEDHGGEFNLGAPAGPNGEPIANIHFWLDPRPAVRRGGRLLPVEGVGRSPQALIAWLRHNDDLILSAPKRDLIAGGVAAESVDLDLAPTAPPRGSALPRPMPDVPHVRRNGLQRPVRVQSRRTGEALLRQPRSRAARAHSHHLTRRSRREGLQGSAAPRGADPRERSASPADHPWARRF
jgi:hypothetical protein